MNIFSKLLLVGGVSETVDGTQKLNASASIGLKNGKLYFSSAGESIVSGGGMSTGIVKDTGELDLSHFPPGDVSISINLEDAVWNAGYRFPGDVYQAVAIVVYPPGSTTTPSPVFGHNNWPAEFDAPSFTAGGQKLAFVDKDDDVNAYEYSIAVKAPNGTITVLDPKIKNGGNRG